ncbi:hypothetical protein N7523_000729 [Penicillium sp. IBT 18751x]|nr:hypothetical protein N7523_000729 [Penicillium sp. IBT 18751x]
MSPVGDGSHSGGPDGIGNAANSKPSKSLFPFRRLRPKLGFSYRANPSVGGRLRLPPSRWAPCGPGTFVLEGQGFLFVGSEFRLKGPHLGGSTSAVSAALEAA